MRFHAKFDATRAIADFANPPCSWACRRSTRACWPSRAHARGLREHAALRVGSAPTAAETHVEFEQRTGQRILERYGMTETGMLTSNPLSGDRRAGSVGPRFPGTGARRRRRGAGVRRGRDRPRAGARPNVFSGYWRMPEKNAEEFTADGWFRTGDVGSLSADGYLTIAGRSKDLIITGGYNVYPKEIELRARRACPACRSRPWWACRIRISARR
jgi:malonyl-CoA/methylmalonyl-CoA synthetase